MSKLFLITTRIIETWDFDKDTLMLGGWCNTFDNKKNLENLKNNTILRYHWNDTEKVFEDYNYLNIFGEKVLSILAQNLNSIHHVNFSKEYWKIITGNWLFPFLHMIYDRWESVSKAFKEYNLESTKILKIDLDEVIPQSIENFIELAHQDKWNHFIFSKILKNNFKQSIKIEEIMLKSKDDYVKFIGDRRTLKQKLLFELYEKTRKIYFKIFSDEKYFISDTYIGKFDEILLNLKLKNFPITISAKSYFFVKPNFNLRKKFSIKMKTNNEFETFALELINDLIPCSFLENYKKIRLTANSSLWPKNPKVIFTSHAINNKTLSSFYIAEKKEQKAILICGQHGGGYGQCKFHWHEKFEKEISDYYLSWGWSDEKKIIPFGMLKSTRAIDKIKNNNKIKDKLLIVIRPKARYLSTPLDSKIRGPQILDYHLDCINVIDKFNKDFKEKNVIVRLHERTYGWCEKELWKNTIPDIEIDLGKDTIYKNIDRSKLVIYTYNSTGYLELLAANTPVLLYWSNTKNPVNLEAESYFKELKNVKIFHEDQDSLIKHVNREWNDVDSWWFSEKVQNVREKFCKKYANLNEHKVDNLKNLIKECELKK